MLHQTLSVRNHYGRKLTAIDLNNIQPYLLQNLPSPGESKIYNKDVSL